MKYYAVIDTNVLVSAMLKWDSVPGHVMELTFNGLIIPVLNPEILGEYREVLSRPKFHLTHDIIDNVLSSIQQKAIFMQGGPLELDLPDPKDHVFYAVVMEARQEEDAYLVTGNLKHFPAEPFVVTPRQLLDIILSDRETQ